MDTLNRGHAPFPAHIWGMIDQAAASGARDRLTGRRFLDLEHGFQPGWIGQLELESRRQLQPADLEPPWLAELK